MYTKACDFMLDVVDGLEEGFTECTEGLVALSATILLRYLREVEVEKAEVESLAQVCLTVASKLTERMYVPLASSTREQRSAEEARRPELELQLLDRLDWKINIITPYGLRATALEAVYALLPLPAPPTDDQRVQCRCARPPRPSIMDPPRPRMRRRIPPTLDFPSIPDLFLADLSPPPCFPQQIARSLPVPRRPRRRVPRPPRPGRRPRRRRRARREQGARHAGRPAPRAVRRPRRHRRGGGASDARADAPRRQRRADRGGWGVLQGA